MAAFSPDKWIRPSARFNLPLTKSLLVAWCGFLMADATKSELVSHLHKLMWIVSRLSVEILILFPK